MMASPPVKDYRFIQALRPFSFAVALVACSCGLTLAWLDGAREPGLMALVLCGGVLLQAGVNLINDYADLTHLPELSILQRQRIVRNYRLGLVCFVLAALIGIGFAWQVGERFLLLCSVGLMGALGYTLQPINYKGRGLGVVLVFWLMGVLMVVGSYTAVTGQWNIVLVPLSVPVSLLVSLLLLSNELRDLEADQQQGIQTLAVRCGYVVASRFYIGLLVATLVTQVLLALLLRQPWMLLPLLVLLRVPRLLALLRQPAGQRHQLTPATGQLLLVFGLLFNAGLLLGYA